MDDPAVFIVIAVIVAIVGVVALVASLQPKGHETKDMTAKPPRSGMGLGKQVRSWIGLVSGMADRGEAVQEALKEQIKRRGLKDVTLTRANIGSLLGGTRTFLLVQQQVGPAAYATTAVRVEPVGEVDLQIEWRHFERGWLIGAARSGGRLVAAYLGIGFIGAGILTAWIGGGGCCLIAIGGPMLAWAVWGGPKKQMVGFQNEASLALNQIVELALQEALDLAGISMSQIRHVGGDAEHMPSAVPARPQAPDPAAPASQPQSNRPGPKFCSECGAPLIAGVKFCSECGAEAIQRDTTLKTDLPDSTSAGDETFGDGDVLL